MARAILGNGDDVRNLYGPQMPMPSYAPSQAPDANVKIQRALGTVDAISKSPLLNVLLRGGQALKGAYDEAVANAAKRAIAERAASGEGAMALEGGPEVPVDTSRQLTSFEGQPADEFGARREMPDGADYSRGLAAAKGLQFMPAVGEQVRPEQAAAARKLEELAPTMDPSGKRFAAQNALAEIGDEARLEERQRAIAQGRQPGAILPKQDIAADDMEARRSAAAFRGAQAAREGGVLQDRLSLNRDEALLAEKRRQDALPFTAEDTLGLGEKIVTPEPRFKGADVAAGLGGIAQDGLTPAEPTPAPGMGGMSLRKTPVTIASATDDQLATVRSRLAGQADDPVVKQRIAQIDAELTDRANRKVADSGPISREEIMQRARMASTQEQQARVLRDLERVQAPITSLEDLLGDVPERRLQREVVSLFPVAPKKTMEEILAEADKDRAMAEYYRERGKGEAVRAPAEAAKANAAAGKYGAQTKTIDAMRDPTVENMRAKTDALKAGTDKLKAQADAIKARKAAGVYRGAGGAGKLKDDLAYFKALGDQQSKDVGDARKEFDAVDKAHSDADRAASAEIARFRSIPAPGNPPSPPGSKADPKEKVEYEDNLAKWNLRKGAYEEAKANVEAAVANRDYYRKERDEAKQALQEATRAAEAKFNPSQAAVQERINKRMGLNVPAAGQPAPAKAPATPTVKW